MISRGTWIINQKIPSVQTLSEHLEISHITIRNVLKSFERSGILENTGKLGYYLISPTKTLLSKNSYYNKYFTRNLTASIWLSEGAKQYNEWLIKVLNTDINILNIITGLEYNSSISEIFNIINNPISLKSILDLNGNEFKSAKIKFNRQKELFPIAKIITYNKKEILC
jgi:DNA-binding GntR family transcriptional regulator